MNAREVLLQIKENDSERAFNALFASHYERLFRVAFYFLQNDDWAKEVTLDVFAEIWEKRKTMVIPDDFRHFSFVMVRNAAMNFLKKEARYSSENLENSIASISSNNPNSSTNPGISPSSPLTETPEEILEQSELFEIYNNLIASLPDRCREVFCLVKEDGKSYAEVATELGISVKTVDAQLQKAMKILREGLGKYLEKSSPKHKSFIFLFL